MSERSDRLGKPNACFKGGPWDNEFRLVEAGLSSIDVVRADPIPLELTEPVPMLVRGRYELVPRETDHLWRVARLYEWKGWDDDA